MKAVAQDRRKQLAQGVSQNARGVSSVSSDLDKLLGPKNLQELEKLEKQVQAKLASNQAIDTDYWEHLLQSLLAYKARAKLREVTKAIARSRMGGVRAQQAEIADDWKKKLEKKWAGHSDDGVEALPKHDGRHPLNPEPMLRLGKDDKALPSISEKESSTMLTSHRERILKQGYIANNKGQTENGHAPSAKRQRTDGDEFSPAPQGGTSLFDREVARGLGENEEIFSAQEPVSTKNLASWSSKHRARKPQFFNRVLLGYEWNKYNQTHYDADNPPPRVVQGYKFNVFYPDLVDRTKAPTYRIEREGGRRKGETWAAAGEQDTCVIRFTAGPPYEDIAFRIVDREWDYSAKRERGFKSSFDKVCAPTCNVCYLKLCCVSSMHLSAVRGRAHVAHLLHLHVLLGQSSE